MRALTPGDASLSCEPVRELHWLLLSAPLLRHTPATPVQRFGEAESLRIDRWLRELDARPTALLDDLQQAAAVHGGTLRLGRRAERLLEFYLRCGPLHRLVAANLPLRRVARTSRDDTTLGEIDFLLEDESGAPWHWELAVKFFLCTAQGPVAHPDEFHGPDHAETLASKLDKLFERQLRHAVPPPHDTRTWGRAAFTRGWLFYRREQPTPRLEGLEPAHLRGFWLTREAAHSLPEGAWLLLDRERWMAPAVATDDSAALDRDALLREIDRRAAAAAQSPNLRMPSAQLVARVGPAAGKLVEIERGFVVPSSW